MPPNRRCSRQTGHLKRTHGGVTYDRDRSGPEGGSGPLEDSGAPLGAGPASISLSRPARRLDYPRRLLFQSALGVVAIGVGGGCCRVQRLGLVAEPPRRLDYACRLRFHSALFVLVAGFVGGCGRAWLLS